MIKKIAALALAGAGFSLAAQEMVPGSPEQAIREVIQEAYVDGVFNEGIEQNVLLGFAPEFQMVGLDSAGQAFVISREDWLERVRAKLEKGIYPLAEHRRIRVDYLRIDVEGPVALVKLKFYVGGKLSYLDFLSLYRFADGWKIVGKVYRRV